MIALVALAAAALLPMRAQGLYFYVTEGQHRCFLEEVPQDTLVVAHYENPDLIPGSNGQEAHVSGGWAGPGLSCERHDPCPPRHAAVGRLPPVDRAPPAYGYRGSRSKQQALVCLRAPWCSRSRSGWP